MAKPNSLTVDIQIDAEPMRRAVDDLVETAEIFEIFGDVQAEIRAARAKHGTQHDTPMGTGPNESLLFELDQAATKVDVYTDEEFTLDCLDNEALEKVVKHWCQETGDQWIKILLEEVLEAAAVDPVKSPAELDDELVQVIAMGVSMLQAHRRQQDPKA